MRFLSVAAIAACATTALGSLSNPFSPIPNYPLGNGICLTDSQAKFLVNTFATALSNSNRAATNATMQVLLSNSFFEESDSIDNLEGATLGSVTFPNKANYILNLLEAPPVPAFQTFAIFHDCTNIAWRWQINELGAGIPIKGINALAANPLTGQLSFDYLEFNSIAWGRDVGWTCTAPPSS